MKNLLINLYTRMHIIICICIVSFLVIPKQVNAQCFGIPLNSVLASNYWAPNTVVTGQTFNISGTFIVNIDITFDHCSFKMQGGSEIIVRKSCSLTLLFTSAINCLPCSTTTMWKGITLEEGTSLIPTSIKLDNAGIHEADVAIDCKDNTSFYIVSSTLYENVISIRTPSKPPGTFNNIQGYVADTWIGFGPFGGFGTSYAGQNQYGTVPYAAMVLNNVVMTIGDNNAGFNLLGESHIGIYSSNSKLTVTNTRISGIHKDAGYYPVYFFEEYAGSCIAALGTAKPCYLNVNPINPPGFEFSSSDIGVYNKTIDMEIANCDFTGVGTGVFSSLNSAKTNYVHDCNILAEIYGIRYFDNSGANYMFAKNNTITVNHGDFAAIDIVEVAPINRANYDIFGNEITILNEVRFGIFVKGADYALIRNNIVHQDGLVVNVIRPSSGIYLQECDAITATCNSINTTVPTNQAYDYGIESILTTNSTLKCNTVTDRLEGLNFRIVDGKWDVAANTMDNCETGLHLDANSTIGVQTHRGNIWQNAPGVLDALNENPNFSNSIMKTHTIPGTNYFPQLLAINPPSWFFYDPTGTPFDCEQEITCGSAERPGGGGEGEYLRAIARNSTFATDYPDEMLNMAQQGLYELLKQNDSLLNSDTVFVNFEAANENSAIGKLYDTKQKVGILTTCDDSYTLLINITDSIIQVKADSIGLIDSLAANGDTTNFAGQRSALIEGINMLSQTISSIELQRATLIAGTMDTARTINATVIPTEMPEANEQFINETYFIYQKYGRDTLLNYYYELLTIAQQCPIAGGKPVMRARVFVGMFNDSISYDDAATCLLLGLYRKGKVTTNQKINFTILPNPAKDYVEIKLLEPATGTGKIIIADALGNSIKTVTFNLNERKILIDTHDLMTGIYIVGTQINGTKPNFTKLAIVR